MKKTTENKITAAQVKACAAALGISDTGICSAEADTSLISHLPDGATPFVAAAENRIAPNAYLNDAQSVIVCAFHYAQPLQPKANISRYAWMQDYHIVVKDYLSRLLEKLQTRSPDVKGYIFSDNSPLCDKALAYRAGLGYFGKNSLLLHPRFGSLFFIGGIVTNLKLEADTPIQGSCGDCHACEKACPAGLCGSGQLNGYACISYLQQKKGDFTEEEAALVRKAGSAWGCDLCINACPHNQGQSPTNIPEFAVIDCFLSPEITKAEFDANYKNRAFHWRGYKTLKRNLDALYK